MPLDYEERYKKAYLENVKNRVVSPKRIKSFCELHGFDIDLVKEAINNNPIVTACFATNPNRQKFHEKMAADFIKNLAGVEGFKNLPPNKLAISGGGVNTKEALKMSGGYSSAKTIDFQWRYRNATFYASHKYTKETGGTQNSHYKGLQSFLNAAKPKMSPNTYFVIIADGEFYRGNDSNANMPRLERLKQIAGGTKVYACAICELEGIMQQATERNKKA